MPAFSATLRKRADVFSGALTQIPYGLTLAPRTWSGSDTGGPDQALIEASGPPEALRALLSWLGDHAEIVNESGTLVWYGYIQEIEVDDGGKVETRDYESLRNRIAVLYSAVLPDGSTESAVTAWAEDTASIARYGVRELLHGIEESDAASAVDVRDRLLESMPRPARIVSNDSSGEPRATLMCRGYWHLTDGVYFEEDGGLVEYDEGSNDTLRIGASYINTTISFGTAVPGGGVDDIGDSANGFSSLVKGTRIDVVGSASNDGSFVVATLRSNGWLETVEKNQVDEAAGASVTISIEGKRITRLAQRFLPTGATTFNAGMIGLRVRRIGSPGDGLKVDLCADSAGAPGTVLDSVTVPAASIFTEMQWIEFALSNTVTLALGTNYWIIVQRTGGDSLTNHYEIALDMESGYTDGPALRDRGSGWETPAGNASDPLFDLLFRVKGFAYVTTLIKTALERVTDFSPVIVTSTVGQPAGDIHFPNPTTVKQRVESLLERGTNDYRRMLIEITPERLVRIVRQPSAAEQTRKLIADKDGNLHYPQGAPLEPGLLVYGKWIESDDMSEVDGAGDGQDTALYIAHSEYSADRARLIWRTENAPDPISVLTFGKG